LWGKVQEETRKGFEQNDSLCKDMDHPVITFPVTDPLLILMICVTRTYSPKTCVWFPRATSRLLAFIIASSTSRPDDRVMR